MRIKKADSLFGKCSSLVKGALNSCLGEKKSRLVLRGAVAVLGLAIIISAVIWRHDIAQYVLVPLSYKVGLIPRVEKISIDISHKNFQKLAYTREMALKTGILLRSDDDYVPAEIRHDNKTYPVRVRLKGDDKDHWSDKEKWSFRIKLKDNRTLFGMRQFSIQHPHTRNYFSEWLFHRLLDYSGIIHLQYGFIEVVVNGKDLGLYALEEHFDNILIERNKYREGPIVRFNDNLYWVYRALDRQEEVDFQEAFWLGAIDVFHPQRTERKEVLFDQYKKSKDILEAYRRGSLKAGKVFNLDQLALFFALMDLWGDPHPNEYHNIRFYYNPVTGLLEPIGYDASSLGDMAYLAGATTDHERKRDWWTWETRLFEDDEFFLKYVHALERVANKEFLDRFFQTVGKDYERTMKVVRAHYPKHHFREKELLYQKQEKIQGMLNPPQGIQAYLHKVDKINNVIQLFVGNVQPMPVEIKGVSINRHVYHPKQRTVLQGKGPSQPVDYRLVHFSIEDIPSQVRQGKDLLEVQYSLYGRDEVSRQKAFQWDFINKKLLAGDIIRMDPNFRSFDFILVDDNVKKIFIRPGKWTLQRDLVIPKGYTVVAPAGLTLDLVNNSTILSYSPLSFIAEEENPIKIESSDSTGQGLTVIDAGHQSYLWNVRFDNLSGPQRPGWTLTGSVNFYQSPVDIRRCRFSRNRDSDDSLNIIRSSFLIDNSSFEINYSDALDIDFSDGKVTNSSFIACGMRIGNGDAIDVAGSRVVIDNVQIKGVNDKGLSIGERSHLTANNVLIKNAKIGVASKDNSQATLNNVELMNVKYGFTAYQKKPEYGPSVLEVTSVKKKNIKQLYLVEQGSSLTLDGRQAPARSFDYRKL